MAIKVNGTTVINDSRALSNIASVDATTATAIGAAGVGGASTLISDSVSVGTGTTFSISFSGSYRAYRLILNGINSSSTYQALAWRYTDGSGNNITGTQDYSFQYASRTLTSRWTVDDKMNIPENYKSGSSLHRAYIDMYIYNPNSTTETTTQRGSFNYTSDSYYTGAFTSFVNTNTYGIGANNSIYFYHTTGGNFSGGTYSLWGLN